MTCTGKCWNMYYVPFWFDRLWSDAAFQNAVKCRWQELRKGPFSLAFADRVIKDGSDAIKPRALARHFARWPELRKYVWPNPCGKETPEPCGSATAPVGEFFDYEVGWMRGWIDRRLKWMDQNLPGTCTGP
jgi:hypothetical protein